MKNDKRETKGIAVQLMALGLIVPFFAASLALAEDEDTSASMYLVFDPDTGEFITVNDPTRSQQHVADQEAIMSGVTTNSDTVDPGAFMTGIDKLWLPALIAALAAVLLGGFFWLRRKR